jgi:response regulator RpfG family c-di-GMP phosphodiesterase
MTEETKNTNVNYSEELTAKIVEAYEVGTNDEERAEILENLSASTGKTVKSLRQKLVREGVYIKKTYKAKTGRKVETKAAIVEGIASAMGVSSVRIESLEKATKPTLELIRATVEIAAQGE